MPRTGQVAASKSERALSVGSCALVTQPQIDLLVVEDDEALRTSYVAILRHAQYRVAEARNTVQAIDALNSTKVGAVLLDIYLPDRSGLWFLDQIDDPPPTILITGHDYDDEIMHRRSKVLMYLQKPVTPLTLLEVVSRALKGDERSARD